MSVTYNPKTITDGLVFAFDPGNTKSYPGFTGTVLYDLTGNSTTGEAVNSPTFVTSAFVTNFFQFNGTTNYLRFTNSTALDTQNFTVSVWIDSNAWPQNGVWFEKGEFNTQYSIIQEGNFIKCKVNTGTSVDTISADASNLGQFLDWKNVVFTFTSGSQVCYFNGVVTNTGTTTGTIATNSGGMSIGVGGGYSGARSYYYNGKQSLTTVYNRVLSQSEVLQNFNAIRRRFLI
jgi:hypothetical protein